MSGRHEDGSAGDTDYAAMVAAYASYRQADPRIAAAVVAALGSARHRLS